MNADFPISVTAAILAYSTFVSSLSPLKQLSGTFVTPTGNPDTVCNFVQPSNMDSPISVIAYESSNNTVSSFLQLAKADFPTDVVTVFVANLTFVHAVP